MNKRIKEITENVRLWRTVAIVAGIYSFVFCVLIIANFTQVNRVDPVNTTVINALVERLSQNPDDAALREEIRQLDLLARKAYFTNQWQIRNGGYLLAIGILVLVIALQLISLGTKSLPVVNSQPDEKYLIKQRKTRLWVSVGGAAIVFVALGFALITRNQMEKTFIQSSIQIKEQNNSAETPDQKISEEKNKESAIVEDINPTSEVKATTSELAKVESTTENNTKQVEAKSSPSTGYATEDEMRSNFPNFRGYGGLGVSYHKNIPTSWDGATGNNILWKSAIPLGGYNSPVVWGDKVFVAGANAAKRELYCFDSNSGKLLWTVNADNIQGTPSKVPSVRGDTGHSAPTTATNGKYVFAIFANGDIIAADMQGNRVWAKNLGLPQNHYGHASSLITHKNLVIVQFDDSKTPKIVALSAATGDEVWSTPRKVKVSWASPIVVNTGKRFEIMLISEPSIASYDPETGKQLWSIDGMYGEVGPSLAYANGIVYGINEYAMIMAVKAGDNPELIWENSDYLSDIPSPVTTDKYLFVVTSYGAVACYNTKEGTLYWNHDFDEGFNASPIIAEGKIYILDKTGAMQIVKADKEFGLISTASIGEKTSATPAFANGKIFIRGDKNLYCIGK
jgi:outer membrane protein assembly factor BamB